MKKIMLLKTKIENKLMHGTSMRKQKGLNGAVIEIGLIVLGIGLLILINTPVGELLTGILATIKTKLEGLV